MHINAGAIASNAPFGVGVMLVGSGLYGVVRPLNMIRFFGLPWAEESHSRIYPAVGVRNLSAGIATLVLSYMGQRQSVGILLASWVAVGMVDTTVVVRDPRGSQRAVHAINTLVLAFVSSLALVQGKYSESVDTWLLTGLGIGLGAMFINSWVVG